MAVIYSLARGLVLFLTVLLLAPSSLPATGNQPLPSLEFQKPGGGTVSSDSFRDDVVLLSFWATWCGACLQELPLLERLHRRLEEVEGVEVVAVNVDEARMSARVRAIWEHGDLTMPLLLEPTGKAVRSLEVTALPMAFVVDPEGVVRYRIVGTQNWDSQQWVRGLQAFREKTKSSSP